MSTSENKTAIFWSVGDKAFALPEQIFKTGRPWKLSMDEPYGIRYFNPDETTDTQRWDLISRHPQNVRWLVPPRPKTAFQKDALLRVPEKGTYPQFLFAVVDDQNKVIGAIKYYHDDREDQARRDGKIPNDARVFEISIRKLISKWPSHHRYLKTPTLPAIDFLGVAESGARQTAFIMRQKVDFQDMQEGRPDQRDIYVTAYVDPENKAMIKVMKKSGFRLAKTYHYDDGAEGTWIKKI